MLIRAAGIVHTQVRARTHSHSVPSRSISEADGWQGCQKMHSPAAALILIGASDDRGQHRSRADTTGSKLTQHSDNRTLL